MDCKHTSFATEDLSAKHSTQNESLKTSRFAIILITQMVVLPKIKRAILSKIPFTKERLERTIEKETGKQAYHREILGMFKLYREQGLDAVREARINDLSMERTVPWAYKNTPELKGRIYASFVLLSRLYQVDAPWLIERREKISRQAYNNSTQRLHELKAALAKRK